MSGDPLLQPYQLKHLTLRNRIMITSHEPAYPDDGMPKDRYRAYHVERARAGVALTMTAGSGSVSRDSPPVFNNILVWKDEVVGWMKQMADECHDHGAAVMIQLTPIPKKSKIGIFRALSMTTPMVPKGCMRPVWMGSNWNATAI
jgi:N-methyl-L-proline demethylase